MSALYINHADADSDQLMAVHEALRHGGVASVFAPTEEAFGAAAQARIDEAPAMVLLVSAVAQKSARVKAALAYAQSRKLEIIPFQVDKAKLGRSWQKQLGDNLRYSRFVEKDVKAFIAAASKLYQAQCPVIAVMNMKGGVGKTTVTSQVFGTYQAGLAGRVLLIDLDPQYNLTQVFFDMDTADANALHDASVISLFEKSRLHGASISPAEDWSEITPDAFVPAPPEELVQELLLGGPSGRLDLICGQFEICKYAFSTDSVGLAAVRRNFLSMIDHYRRFYDLIVLDTNPNATFLTDACMAAANHILVPMQADMYSLRGVKLLNQIREMSANGEDSAPDIHVLFNRVNRSERSDFEAEARNGAYDALTAFAFSRTILEPVLPFSGHYVTPSPKEETQAWRQLLTHYGRGGGLKLARNYLLAVAQAVQAKITA